MYENSLFLCLKLVESYAVLDEVPLGAAVEHRDLTTHGAA